MIRRWLRRIATRGAANAYMAPFAALGFVAAFTIAGWLIGFECARRLIIKWREE